MVCDPFKKWASNNVNWIFIVIAMLRVAEHIDCLIQRKVAFSAENEWTLSSKKSLARPDTFQEVCTT